MSALESLPAEVIANILTFLPPISLAQVSATSRHLKAHALRDSLWADIVRSNLPAKPKLESCKPAKSWKDLYIAHHPYWFLVRRKIWFSDEPNNGRLVLVRYDHRRGCIEGYRLLDANGSNPQSTFQLWDYDNDVRIWSFHPKLHLFLDDPVIKLDYIEKAPENRIQEEIRMQTSIGTHHGIRSMISLCQAIPPRLQDPSMALWPPSNIPAVHRVRNESFSQFRHKSNRPSTSRKASDWTFRIRKWMEYSNLMRPLGTVRMGEDVATFSTLYEGLYIPTKRKPYQGIWVGDYSAHSCEFLLVLQLDQPPTSIREKRHSTGRLPSGVALTELSSTNIKYDSDSGYSADGSSNPSPDWHSPSECENNEAASTNDQPSGCLVAIKLTGDVNVPRGQYTFIAEDISDAGLIRIADDDVFRGARIVESMGHVADQGFRDDRYITSQLIIVSHDCLAQYWPVSWVCQFQGFQLIYDRSTDTSPTTNGSISMNIYPSEPLRQHRMGHSTTLSAQSSKYSLIPNHGNACSGLNFLFLYLHLDFQRHRHDRETAQLLAET